jgi:hypothetical protein
MSLMNGNEYALVRSLVQALQEVARELKRMNDEAEAKRKAKGEAQ